MTSSALMAQDETAVQHKPQCTLARGRGSNPEPIDWQSTALPHELPVPQGLQRSHMISSLSGILTEQLQYLRLIKIM